MRSSALIRRRARRRVPSSQRKVATADPRAIENSMCKVALCLISIGWQSFNSLCCLLPKKPIRHWR